MIKFRIISDKLDIGEIQSQIKFDNPSNFADISKHVFPESHSEEYIAKIQIEGQDKWDRLNQILKWVKQNETGIQQIKSTSDVKLDVSIICNVKGMKNPIPEETKGPINGITFVEITVRSEAKESKV